MSRIDGSVGAPDVAVHSVSRSARLSRDFFDEVVTPLSALRRTQEAQPYFPSWRDVDRSSYFVPANVSTMRPDDFEFPGGGTAAGLIDALAAHWSADEEPELSDATGRLTAIVEALLEVAPDKIDLKP